MAQLGYCFAAQSIPKSSWKYIMKKAKKVVLQRSGMVALFPQKALYGPVRYGGFGFKNPYTQQGIIKLATILQESIDWSQTGIWIQAAVEEYKLFTGIDNYVQETSFKKIKEYFQLLVQTFC